MDEQYPKLVSDPEAGGLPEYADDDSHADEEADAARIADGPDPAALPRDRDDGPLAMDEYGTTPAEQRRGEPLDLRLSREEPDVTPDTLAPLRDAGPDEPPGADAGLDEGPVDPHLGSVVSMYDRAAERPVGRLVAPDEGAHEDAETDAVARDAGAAGGGASAEELAMHPVPEDGTS